MRRFAANSPVGYSLSLGICVSLLIQESGAQCFSDCTAHKCCDYDFGCSSVDERCESSSFPDYLDRPATLTGDWWGLRPCLEDHGIEFDAAVDGWLSALSPSP